MIKSFDVLKLMLKYLQCEVKYQEAWRSLEANTSSSGNSQKARTTKCWSLGAMALLLKVPDCIPEPT